MEDISAIGERLEIAAAADLPQILDLQRRAFYGQAVIYDDFTLPPLTQTIEEITRDYGLKQFFVLKHNGKVIASIRCHIDKDILYIEKVIVDPVLHDNGIGTRIMLEVEERFREKVKGFALFTGEKSERNLHLYKKLGYREVSREQTPHGYKLVHMAKENIRPE